jgi:hypothetical protein
MLVVRVRGRVQGISAKVFTLGGETILYPHTRQEWDQVVSLLSCSIVLHGFDACHEKATDYELVRHLGRGRCRGGGQEIALSVAQHC